VQENQETEALLGRREFMSKAAKAAMLASTAVAAGGLMDGYLAGSTAGAATKKALFPMKLQLPWLENVQAAGEFVAESKGYYGKNGLNVTLLSGGPNVSIEPVVVAGTAFVGLSSADVVARARLEGAPLKIIGAQYQKNPYTVISSAHHPIKSPQGLVGKTIGVSASNLTVYNVMLKLNHIDPSKVTRVPVQFDPTPLVDGEVDAWLGYISSDAVTLKLKGFPIYTFLLSDFGYHIWGDVYETTEDRIDKYRDQLISFLAAERQGWNLDIKNPQLGDTLAVTKYGKNLGLTLKSCLLQSEEQVPLMVTSDTRQNGLFWMSDAGQAQNIATMKIAGVNAYQDLFDNSLLAEL
jgi:ABC-type nitrate/sulfonate/bicarbonate transport system substrate-binding protein